MLRALRLQNEDSDTMRMLVQGLRQDVRLRAERENFANAGRGLFPGQGQGGLLSGTLGSGFSSDRNLAE